MFLSMGVFACGCMCVECVGGCGAVGVCVLGCHRVGVFVWVNDMQCSCCYICIFQWMEAELHSRTETISLFICNILNCAILPKSVHKMLLLLSMQAMLFLFIQLVTRWQVSSLLQIRHRPLSTRKKRLQLVKIHQRILSTSNLGYKPSNSAAITSYTVGHRNILWKQGLQLTLLSLWVLHNIIWHLQDYFELSFPSSIVLKIVALSDSGVLRRNLNEVWELLRTLVIVKFYDRILVINLTTMWLELSTK